MDAKYTGKLKALEVRLLEQPGKLDPSIRRAAAEGVAVPGALASYVDAVRRHAYEITEDDVASLIAAGYSEDQVFEVTVAAAFGAARTRLQAGLDALEAPTHARRSNLDRSER